MTEDYSELFPFMTDNDHLPRKKEDGSNYQKTGPSEIVISNILRYGAGLFYFKSQEKVDHFLLMN